MVRFVTCALALLALITMPAGAQSPPADSVNVSGTAADSTAPAIARSPDGTLHIAWQEAGGEVYVAESQDADWASSALVIGDSPALAVGPSDVAHLAYVADDGTGNLEIFHSQQTAGEWSVPSNVSLTSSTSATPDLAVAADGTPHFVWTDATPGEPTVYHGTPEGASPISNARGIGPSIAIDSDEQVHVIWQEPDGDTGLDDVFHMRSGGAFAVNLSASPSVDSQTPDITVTPNGAVHAAWIEGGAVQVRSGQPPNFASAITISSVATGTAGVRIASDTAGNVFAAWTEAGSRIRAAVRWAQSATWQPPQTIADELSGLETIALAAGANGQVHLAWSAYPSDAAAGDIYVATSAFVAPLNQKVYLPLIARSESP